MTDNIRGIFTLDICDKERELKCNFGVVEKLERQILKRPALQALSEACTGYVYISEIADVIKAGLEANGGTSLSRSDIGQGVQEKGIKHFLPFYIEFLTYAVTGERDPVIDENIDDGDEHKKK